MAGEFTCKACGHNFNKLVSCKDNNICCPRCGAQELEQNLYLLGTSKTDDLTIDDYCDVALAPCCTPDWKGWRNVFYGAGTWQPEPCPNNTPAEKEKEKEKLEK